MEGGGTLVGGGKEAEGEGFCICCCADEFWRDDEETPSMASHAHAGSSFAADENDLSGPELPKARSDLEGTAETGSGVSGGRSAKSPQPSSSGSGGGAGES